MEQHRPASTWRKLTGRYHSAHWHILLSRFLNGQCWGMGKCGHLFWNASRRLLDYLKQKELSVESFNWTCFRKEQASVATIDRLCSLSVNIPLSYHNKKGHLKFKFVCSKVTLFKSEKYDYLTQYILFLKVESKLTLHITQFKSPYGSYFGNPIWISFHVKFQTHTEAEGTIKWNHYTIIIQLPRWLILGQSLPNPLPLSPSIILKQIPEV